MKTIILYATTYGTTRDIARRIAKQMGGADICDFDKDYIPSLADYDCVVAGGPVYSGKLPNKAAHYLSKHAGLLKGKRLGLFLSGIETAPEKKTAMLEKNFSPDLLAAAKDKAFIGGIFDPSKAGGLGRFTMMLKAGRFKYADRMDDRVIESFAKVMRGS